MAAEMLACGRASIDAVCAVAPDGRFDCPVPAGALDLRAAATEFVPFYFWDLRVEPDRPLDLGILRLRRGASIAGFVTGSELPRSAQVRADRVRLGGEAGPEDLKAERMQAEASADERGFFQLTGLPPGQVRLTAAAGNRISAVQEVTVKEAEELALSEPLELSPPLEATFFVEPATLPTGAPWKAAVSREGGGRIFDLDEKEVSLQGSVVLGGLAPGAYRLELRDEGGSVWHRQRFEIAESRTFFVELAFVEVRGRLLLGDRGRPGQVVFGANQVPRLAFRADEEGVFEGILPRDGDWPLLVEWPSGERRKLPPVEIRRRAGKEWAELEVVLPATSLSGRVTKEGKRIPASVMVRRSGQPDLASNVLAQDGDFEFLGLEPGRYEISAVDRQEYSSWREVELHAESEAPFVHLEIGASREARGILLHGGQPVPGAQIAASSSLDGQGFEGALRATSRIDGGFSLTIPKSLETLDLLVTAPGLPLWLGRARFDPKDPAVFDLASPSGDLYFLVDEPAEWEVRFGDVQIDLGSLLRILAQQQGAYRQRDGDRAYLAASLPAGPWMLCPHGAGECSTALLAPGASVELAPPP